MNVLSAPDDLGHPVTNERLRAAIASVGLTPEMLASRVAVDPKTVERWISNNRVPHRAHRITAAVALGKDPLYLWPTSEADAWTTSASQAELVTIYPNRGSVAARTWLTLLEQAHESVEILAFAASFLHDALPDFNQLLAAKARAGVYVRLLLGDPESDAVRTRGVEEGIGDLLAARCRLTWSYFAPVLAEPGVSARKHGCTLYTSMFRFDDTVLMNPHTYGAPASHSPVIHIQRVTGGRLFSNCMEGFDRTWDLATPVAAAGSS